MRIYTKILIALHFVLSTISSSIFAQQQTFKGQILDKETEKPVVGAVIISNTGLKSVADAGGFFQLNLSQSDTSFHITSISYETLTFNKGMLSSNDLKFYLTQKNNQIQEVLVSTGYETLQKRNATGAFDVIDQELLQRSTGQNIISRIENLTPGLYFDKTSSGANFSMVGRPAQHNMYLQGISTLRQATLGASAPLIILDNFIYEGDLNTINPNDVLSVTILKDAAAAAIWGAKAGNGVIVIKTKGATNSGKLAVDFQNSLQINAKPDLYANKFISMSELIDLEIDLYNRGFYLSRYNSSTKLTVPPVVELLYRNANGEMSDQDLNAAIENYKGQDVRESMLKYLFRNAALHQHNLRLSGGANNYKYGLSVGYDKSLATRIGDKNDRISLKMDNAVDINDKMTILASLRWNLGKEERSTGSEYYNEGGYRFPYVSIADPSGNALAIPWDYRTDYIENTGEGKLLDWSFRPLDEARNPGVGVNRSEIIADLNFKYQLLPALQLSADYRFLNSSSELTTHNNLDHYYTRNLINRGSQITANGVTYNFPYGSILEKSNDTRKSHNARMQLNLSTNLGEKHHIRAILGFDITDSKSENSSFTRFGYNDQTGLFSNTVMHGQRYPIYDNLATYGIIPYPVGEGGLFVNRTVSAYFNGSYTFASKHIFSSSLRKDAANVFGLETNNKWTPLWSAGYSYLLDNEKFYNIQWLPKLKLRTTYGVSGNVDNSMSSNTTIYYSQNAAEFGTSYNGASVSTLPNPNLRWEKVKQLNLALDFSIGKSERVRGSVDFFGKYTHDLLHSVSINATLGRPTAVYNIANTKTKGVNISLNTLNIVKPFKWESGFNFGYNNSWIVKAHQKYSGPSRYTSGLMSMKDSTMVFGLYSYKWGGLDPETGAPRGILDGEPSTAYSTITGTKVPFEDLVFHGSTRPLYFGSLMNNFSYKKVALSFNLIYQMDFYFRRTGMDYANLINNSKGHIDYTQRWQKPGDENQTHVPALTYPVNTAANNFYLNSEPLVEPGDFIRLNDIRMDYRSTLQVKNQNLRFTLFGMVNNLGVLWKSSKIDFDPQYRGNIPPPTYYSVGFNLSY